jgi:hypothetical protein
MYHASISVHQPYLTVRRCFTSLHQSNAKERITATTAHDKKKEIASSSERVIFKLAAQIYDKENKYLLTRDIVFEHYPS